ncbi:MAG: hypothetical protein ACYCYO_22770, partial [Bacilli bacterium]
PPTMQPSCNCRPLSPHSQVWNETGSFSLVVKKNANNRKTSESLIDCLLWATDWLPAQSRWLAACSESLADCLL